MLFRSFSTLNNGAQPSERVEKLLKISGAWDDYKGLPEGTSVTEPPVVEAKPSRKAQEAEKAAEEPAVEEPAVEEPAVEEPAVEEPAAEEPAAEEPAAEEPAAEEPAAEEPEEEEKS